MTSTHHRLDPDVCAAARKALDDDPRVPQDVRVHVDLGTVTLTGTVRWPHEKAQAERIRQTLSCHAETVRCLRPMAAFAISVANVAPSATPETQSRRTS